MNLYFRLLWIIVRSFFKPRIDFADKITLTLHILPNDLDINRHLNNGRYLTLLDLGSIDFFLRSGVLKRALRRGVGDAHQFKSLNDWAPGTHLA